MLPLYLLPCAFSPRCSGSSVGSPSRLSSFRRSAFELTSLHPFFYTRPRARRAGMAAGRKAPSPAPAPAVADPLSAPSLCSLRPHPQAALGTVLVLLTSSVAHAFTLSKASRVVDNQITKVETKTNSTFKLDGDSQWSSQAPLNVSPPRGGRCLLGASDGPCCWVAFPSHFRTHWKHSGPSQAQRTPKIPPKLLSEFPLKNLPEDPLEAPSLPPPGPLRRPGLARPFPCVLRIFL